MTEKPTMINYAHLIFTLFARFQQTKPHVLKYESMKTFKSGEMTVLFTIFQFRRLFEFSAQRRWLEHHPEVLEMLKFERIPHRTTFSRRYKALSALISEFIFFIGQEVEDFDIAFSNDALAEDKSLFKASGPVWHQSDRKENRIPEKLRRLDQDATWSKSGYHGWVYGYGLHITCTEAAFPKMIRIETASVSDSEVIDEKADTILDLMQPSTMVADDGYTKAMRIRNWLKRGTFLITPALKWVHGKYAEAYHQLLETEFAKEHFVKRKTSVEPLFDLVAKMIDATGLQKQLRVQWLENVRTYLALGVLSVQISMIMNSRWGHPLREISQMRAAFS